eukprot:Skav212498  [mRNA]  locus=scaffold2060:123834:133664:+ [translate_table: standard]
MSPSSMATRMGQFGVGQARMSAAQDTACSRLRARSRSMVSVGNNFLRSRSGRMAEHSGHVMEAAPISKRACHAGCTVPSMPTSQANRSPGRGVAATNLAYFFLAVELHGTRAAGASAWALAINRCSRGRW